MGIELNYGNKATINTGNYENISPMFNIKKILESTTDLNINQEFNEMWAEGSRMEKEEK